MIELERDTLHLRFPEVHPDAHASISFQRTLRVPDDNQDYPLPAGLGRFPVESVDDFPVPSEWRDRGGVFLPIRRAEALWIDFGGVYPMAIKIAAGKINAVTGETWSDRLSAEDQDYVVVPDQPWLDGFHVDADVVRQFVAMPLGEGATAEEQLTGEAVWGGLQVVAYPMKAAVYAKLRQERAHVVECWSVLDVCHSVASPAMGLAPGGRIRQEIEEDPHGVDAWDMDAGSRCFVHLLNAELWPAYTGQPAPSSPITAEVYRRAGIPWFEHYADGPVVPGSVRLAGMDGVASFLAKRGQRLADNAPIAVGRPVRLGGGGRRIRGSF